MGKRSGGWKLLIVDDDPQRRRDLEANSQEIPDVASVTAAAGIGEATGLLETDPPDVVIVELESASRSRVAEFGRDARASGASVILVTAGQDPSTPRSAPSIPTLRTSTASLPSPTASRPCARRSASDW